MNKACSQLNNRMYCFAVMHMFMFYKFAYDMPYSKLQNRMASHLSFQ